jgi:phage virion morphogenesis protein
MAGCSFEMNLSPLTSMIQGAAAHMARRRELAAAAGELLVSSTTERFETGGPGPGGEAWKPSKKASGQTLVDSGRLKASVGYEASEDVVAVGTSVVYGRIHQDGGQAGRNHATTIPARPYLGVSEEDKEELKGLSQDFLAQAFRK